MSAQRCFDDLIAERCVADIANQREAAPDFVGNPGNQWTVTIDSNNISTCIGKLASSSRTHTRSGTSYYGYLARRSHVSPPIPKIHTRKAVNEKAPNVQEVYASSLHLARPISGTVPEPALLTFSVMVELRTSEALRLRGPSA